MPTPYALSTPIRGAVKPVGEQLLIDFAPTTASTAGDSFQWDYEIDANLVLTDAMLVKTGVGGGAGTITLEVIKVSDTGAATVIGSLVTGAAPAIGTVVRATSLYANGGSTSLTSRLVGVLSQTQGVAGTANSQQRVRVKLTYSGINTAAQAACFVKLNFARYSSVNSKFDEVTTVTL